jgi:pSer/pThr/pTyr-binding forkhead associated (FHA) protein
MAEARIVVRYLSGSKANRVEQFPLAASPQLTIGRAPSSKIQFDAMNDTAVSRRHAVITVTPSDPPSFKLSDLGSANGTLRNGRAISRESELLPGDEIGLGAGGPKFIFDMDPRPSPFVDNTRFLAHTVLLNSTAAPPPGAAGGTSPEVSARRADEQQARKIPEQMHAAVLNVQMDGILTSGIVVVSISVICVIFGYVYLRNHPFGMFIGDPTYSLAGWAVGLGLISFFTGLGLLIAGLVRHNSRQQ